MSTYQVRSLEEADQIIKEHERKRKTTYSLLRSTKNFGCVDVPACSNDEYEVRFETVGVPYCGVPFFVAGLKILRCQSYRGKCQGRRKIIKIEDGNQVDSGEEEQNIKRPPFKRKKKGGRPNRNGCTATIIMKEVIYYPEFQLYDHSKNNRIAVARQLKEALKSKTQIQKDRIFYVTVPSVSDHYGHIVGMGVSKVCEKAAKRIYVKNDFYGLNEPGSSKRVYYPVKQEKLNMNHLTRRLKVDEDDTEAKAKEVREALQSIMALTYKPGTTEAYQELRKDLLQAKLKYQQTMEALLLGISPQTVIAAPQEIPFSGAHQVVAVQAAPSNPKVIETSSNSTGWSASVASSLPANATVIPGTRVVAVATLPITVSSAQSTVAASVPITVANTVTVQPQSTGNASADSNSNQETSIFIEAMEAIFNSQI